MVATEAVQYLLTFIKFGGVINLLSLEACSAQTFDVVFAVDPTMIVLTK